MSQAGTFKTGGGGSGDILTLTGNIGGPVGPDGGGNINVVGSGSISISGNPGTNTLTISLTGGTGVTSITGDTGGPITGALTITGSTSGASFDTTGTTITESFNFLALPDTNNPLTTGYISFNGQPVIALYGGYANQNIFIGGLSGNAANTGIQNTALGYGALLSLTSGTTNVALGNLAMPLLTTAVANVAVGQGALNSVIDSGSNVAVGQGALDLLSSTGGGNGFNVAIGSSALDSITSGVNNIGVGTASGSSFVSTESNNIIIGSTGITGDNNQIRIGTQGTGDGEQNLCNIAGIYGSTVGATNAAVFIDNSGNLGTVGGSGGGVSSITGDSGGAQTGAITLTGGTSGAIFTGSSGTITESFNFLNMADTNSGGTTGYIALSGTPILAAYHGVSSGNIFLGKGSGIASLTGTGNACIGFGTGAALTTGGGNSALGTNALAAVTSGLHNTAIGNDAGLAITSGQNNTSLGVNALESLTTSNSNTAIGDSALMSLVTGSTNTALGFQAGSSYTGSESSNVVIGSTGTASESNVIRIGTQGSGTGQQNTCFIAGITGVTVVGSAVLCDGTGKLGTVVSSKKFKTNIHDLTSHDSTVLKLRPVSFTYKGREELGVQYGLIAEEVQDIMPDLVIRDETGDPSSVKYHDLPVLLLKEIQRLNQRIEALEGQFSARVR